MIARSHHEVQISRQDDSVFDNLDFLKQHLRRLPKLSHQVLVRDEHFEDCEGIAVRLKMHSSPPKDVFSNLFMPH